MDYGDGKENPRLFLIILAITGVVAVASYFGNQHFPTITGKLILFAFGTAFLLASAWGLTSGRIPGRGEWYVRTETPFRYWMNVLGGIAVGIGFIVWGIRC